MALSIVKDKHKADDLVNDMYLKMHSCNKKYSEINEWFIYRVMANQLVDEARRLKTKNGQTIFVDKSREFLIESINTYDLVEREEEFNFRLDQLDKALDEIEFFDKRYLLETFTRSLRKCSEILNIPVMTLHYKKHKALKAIRETKAIKEI